MTTALEERVQCRIGRGGGTSTAPGNGAAGVAPLCVLVGFWAVATAGDGGRALAELCWATAAASCPVTCACTAAMCCTVAFACLSDRGLLRLRRLVPITLAKKDGLLVLDVELGRVQASDGFG